MPEKKENRYPKLNFRDDGLTVKFEHDCIASKNEVEWHRWVTQQRISQRLGRDVPIEEIYVRPEVGEVYKAVTSFRVGLDTKELYIGLRILHHSDPSTLLALLEQLESYDKQHELSAKQQHLLRNAIGGLKRIINPEIDKN